MRPWRPRAWAEPGPWLWRPLVASWPGEVQVSARTRLAVRGGACESHKVARAVVVLVRQPYQSRLNVNVPAIPFVCDEGEFIDRTRRRDLGLLVIGFR